MIGSSLDPEVLLRLSVSVGLLSVFVVWEWLAPRRRVAAHRGVRWSGNLGIQLIDALVLRLFFPGAAVGVAVWLQHQDIGVLAWLELPFVLEALISLLVLDLAVYVQHVFAHRWPWLWRLHRMHHSDLHLDATSGLRFHPLEILLSMVWKSLVLVALGAPPAAVLLFELALNGTAIFNHANIRLPARWDRKLRWVVVTPDMHRVHHSIYRQETNSNYGFNLPWWDRCFGTYREQPRDGHADMRIGIPQFRQFPESRLDRLLLQPLRAS